MRQEQKRLGLVSKAVLAFWVSVVLVAGLVYLAVALRPDAGRAASGKTVRVYCASGLAKPIEQLIDKFNREYGGKVEIVRTGGSGELAGQLQTEAEADVETGADLYVTADEILLAKLHTEGIIAERFSLAKQKPVVAVAAESDLHFDSLVELLNTPGIRFGVASERAAVGKKARKIARQNDVHALLEENKTTDSENVMVLAQALIAGSLDAAVIWDTTVAQVNSVNSDEAPLLKIAALADPRDEVRSDIAVGVVDATEVATSCLTFCRYLTAATTAESTFDQFGFTFMEGDRWEERPEIHLYCGSMFTPVLEQAVNEFAMREGINIYPRWEGCGKLIASMQSIVDEELFPDAYLACDVSFLEDVSERFSPPIAMTNNHIVIAIRRENINEIVDPDDLLSDQWRVGICDPQQSALGRLTQNVLSKQPYQGMYDEMAEQSAVTVDVGPTLVSQLLAGGLDAAFVYRSNVMASKDSRDKLAIIELDPRASGALAKQPWAVSKTTANPKLMNRFFEWINRSQIHQKFEELGFELEVSD